MAYCVYLSVCFSMRVVCIHLNMYAQRPYIYIYIYIYIHIQGSVHGGIKHVHVFVDVHVLLYYAYIWIKQEKVNCVISESVEL